MSLPKDLLVENVPYIDNIKKLNQLSVNIAKEAEKEATRAYDYTGAFLDRGVQLAEIAERLGRSGFYNAKASFYAAMTERLTKKMDDPGQHDSPDSPNGPNGPDAPTDPDTPYDYEADLKPNGKTVNGSGYSQP